MARKFQRKMKTVYLVAYTDGRPGRIMWDRQAANRLAVDSGGQLYKANPQWKRTVLRREEDEGDE